MSGKHWAGRVVAAVQILSWSAVSCLLLNKGLTNINNATKVAEQGKEPRGMTSGVVMVATASFMLLVSPTILIIKFIEARRRRKRLQISEEDLPPSYEQAMHSSAPRYSTLFLDAGCEVHEQLLRCQDIEPQPTIIPINQTIPRNNTQTIPNHNTQTSPHQPIHIQK
ncbi:uncharacterized protein LOC111055523 [Nilaparvata lugens]|uniref:uncharacterized protein LOC111055523 n=1 Tax=Nilaparvata lugens TaxID=108931 RepID=UPI00193E182C|nr:uncharacterized protein LOC111055523 [Nilaparvata lugens]